MIRGRAARDLLMKDPGIKFSESFLNEYGIGVAIFIYEDEATHNRLINDPNGLFSQILSETKLEEVSTWIRSERGEVLV